MFYRVHIACTVLCPLQCRKKTTYFFWITEKRGAVCHSLMMVLGITNENVYELFPTWRNYFPGRIGAGVSKNGCAVRALAINSRKPDAGTNIRPRLPTYPIHRAPSGRRHGARVHVIDISDGDAVAQHIVVKRRRVYVFKQHGFNQGADVACGRPKAGHYRQPVVL